MVSFTYSDSFTVCVSLFAWSTESRIVNFASHDIEYMVNEYTESRYIVELRQFVVPITSEVESLTLCLI